MRRRSILVFLVLVSVVGCKSKAAPAEQEVAVPPAAPATVSSEPAASESDAAAAPSHFATINAAKNTLLFADFAGHQVALRQLRERGLGEGHASSWGPYVERIRALAQEGTDDADTLAKNVAEIAVECGGCHAEHGVKSTIAFEDVQPTEESGFKNHMAIHRWALETMWAGLAAPSNDQWQAGAKRIAGHPAHLRDLAQYGDSADQAIKLAEGVHALATTALKATSQSQRSEVFGRLLASCAGCHRLKPAP